MTKTVDQQIKELEEHKATILRNARYNIADTIATDHQHAHNLISITLRSVAEELGIKYANQIVDEYKLQDRYFIEKEEE